jgi:hypothetical protein
MCTVVSFNFGVPARSAIDTLHRRTSLLHVLREATGANWSDAATARIADLGTALERDGFHCPDDAPANWYWIRGGRP